MIFMAGNTGEIQFNDALGNIDEFCRNSLIALMKVVRASHTLPKAGDDYEFYSSFAGFQEFASYQKERLMKNINTLMKNNGFKSSLSVGGVGDADDGMDQLIECNDGILERVSAILDSYGGKKQDGDLLSGNASSSDKSPDDTPMTIVSSWNRSKKSGDSKTFRLLHAHNILRPQLKFKDYIDNTNTPFVPKIKVKPNALKPLSKSLMVVNSSSGQKNDGSAIANLIKQVRNAKAEDQSIYMHPYQYELASWQPVPSQLQKTEPIKYTNLDQESCIFIDAPDELDKLVESLENVKELAVDLEHHSYRSFQGITCLMQISTRDQDYIVDTLALRSELSILNRVFTDPEVVKVFHGADSDILWLQRDLGLYVVNMFDTGIASRTLGLPRNSLDFLGEHYCSVHFNKKYQLADWRVRPLPKEMLYYAQGDTHYLLYIYDVMKNQLIERTNGDDRMLRHVLNRSRELCLLRFEKPITTSESHLLLLDRRSRHSASKQKIRSPQQLEALRLIYGWRDSMARQEDESPGYVLPNHMLLQIAEILPREAQGVLACCNPIPPLLRQHVIAVHQLVVQARSVSNNAPTSAPLAPSNNESTDTGMAKPAKSDDDSNNMLQCPHDLSHLGRTSAKSLFDNKKSNRCIVRADKKSTLFGPFSHDLSSNDGVSSFKNGDISCALTPVVSNDNSEKSQDVLKTFLWDPFAFYMPTSIATKGAKKRPASESAGTESEEKLTLRHMLSGNFTWKMRRLEIESDDKQDEEENPEPKSFGKVIEISKDAQRSTGEQVEALKKMMKSKKKKTDRYHPHSFSAPAISFSGVPDGLQQSPHLSEHKHMKSHEKGIHRKRNQHRESPQSATGSQKRDFTPHQYKDEDYQQFRRRNKSKKMKFK